MLPKGSKRGTRHGLYPRLLLRISSRDTSFRYFSLDVCQVDRLLDVEGGRKEARSSKLLFSTVSDSSAYPACQKTIAYNAACPVNFSEMRGGGSTISIASLATILLSAC